MHVHCTEWTEVKGIWKRNLGYQQSHPLGLVICVEKGRRTLPSLPSLRSPKSAAWEMGRRGSCSTGIWPSPSISRQVSGTVWEINHIFFPMWQLAKISPLKKDRIKENSGGGKKRWWQASFHEGNSMWLFLATKLSVLGVSGWKCVQNESSKLIFALYLVLQTFCVAVRPWETKFNHPLESRGRKNKSLLIKVMQDKAAGPGNWHNVSIQRDFFKSR